MRRIIASAMLWLAMAASCFGANFTVATVADLATARPGDGDVVTTLGYTTAGVGANTYRYDADSAATVDGGFVISGPGAVGRYIAIDQTIAHWDQFGCVGNNTTDDTVRAQAALDSNKPNRLGARTYLITDTLTVDRTLGESAPSIEGEDVRNSIISVDSGSAISILEMLECDGFALRNFQVAKKTSPTTPGLWTAIYMRDCQRFQIDNVYVVGAAVGAEFDKDSFGTFLWTANQLRMRYCKTGFIGGNISSVRGTMHIENCTVQPFVIHEGDAVDLVITDQSNHARTSASTIDGCRGVSLRIYGEDGGAATVPFLSVGATTECLDLTLYGRLANPTAGTTALLAIDRVDGGRCSMSFTNVGFNNLVTTTTNTENFAIDSPGDLSTGSPVILPANLYSQQPINYWPDPYMHYGLIGTLSRALTTNTAAAAAETTIKPAFATNALKVTATDGDTGGNCYAQQLVVFDDFPVLYELRGKTIGMGVWMYVQANHPCTAVTSGTDAIGPHFFAQAEGGASLTLNNTKKVKTGTWNFYSNEMTVGAADTYIVMQFFAVGNGASYTADTNSIAYFSGPVIWTGGYANRDAVANGRFTTHAQASNPFHRVGAYDPSGATYAPVGTIFSRTNGGASTSLYVKESGAGAASGWVAK